MNQELWTGTSTYQFCDKNRWIERHPFSILRRLLVRWWTYLVLKTSFKEVIRSCEKFASVPVAQIISSASNRKKEAKTKEPLFGRKKTGERNESEWASKGNLQAVSREKCTADSFCGSWHNYSSHYVPEAVYMSWLTKKCVTINYFYISHGECTLRARWKKNLWQWRIPLRKELLIQEMREGQKCSSFLQELSLI